MKDHKPLVIGHAGAVGLAPANTLAGFRAALANDVDMIETDIAITKDGIVVLHHGPVTALLHKRADTADVTYELLKEQEPDILTLEELFDLTKHSVRLLLDFKDTSAAPMVRKILDNSYKNGWKPADFMITAFSFRAQRILRDTFPDVELLVLDRWSGVRAAYHARKLGTDMICINQLYMWSGFVRSMSKHYRLFCYTPMISWLPVGDSRSMRLAKYGLYGVVTDFPDRYKK